MQPGLTLAWFLFQIERSRSRAAQMEGHRPTTLPRRKSSAETCSPGIFVKAHEQKKMLQAAQAFASMNFVQPQVNFYDSITHGTVIAFALIIKLARV